MAKYKIVMLCTAPVMDAVGNQVHKPGDTLPVGDPATEEGSDWKPIVVDDAATPTPKPEPVVEAPKPVPAPPAAFQPAQP